MKAILGRIHPFGGGDDSNDGLLAARVASLRAFCCCRWSRHNRARAAELPARYYRLMEAGCASVRKTSRRSAQRRSERPSKRRAEHRTGSSLEITWAHFGYAILPPAVLYAKQHPANTHYHDPKMLALAIRIGDLLAAADEKDEFEPRLDSDWDTYTWLEAISAAGAGTWARPRRERWKKCIVRNASLLVANAIDRLDSPWYQTPYILTSPNHYAQWASLLLLTGRTFQNEGWEKLGARILQRFATTEQSPDGYWGEHNSSGPTTGYNHLTLQSVALYWELTHDPDAESALRRATRFHENFTFLDGTPVDVINDRNRHWGVSSWAHFAFSNFSDGRGYAEYLADFFDPEHMTMNLLGRIAQDALYYHDGESWEPSAAVPAGLSLPDEGARRDSQNRTVASSAFRHHELAGDSQSVLSGPPRQCERVPSKSRFDHHWRGREAAARTSPRFCKTIAGLNNVHAD